MVAKNRNADTRHLSFVFRTFIVGELSALTSCVYLFILNK